jgi:hypothetical protein
MYIPIETVDIILAYGFSWCMDTGRLVNKEWKDKIDKMVHGIFVKSINIKRHCDFIWKSPIYEMKVTPEVRVRVLVFNLIIQINNEIAIKKVSEKQKFTNKQCVGVYGYVFDACSTYTISDKIYKRLEYLFDHSFSLCIDTEGKIDMTSIEQYRKFYRIIFGNMIYYTKYESVTPVNVLMEERIQHISETAYHNLLPRDFSQF